MSRGDFRGARDACARAVAGDRFNKEGVREYDFVGCLGEAELALGDIVSARQHLEESVAVTARINSFDLTRVQLALADALTRAVATGPDRPIQPSAAELDRARALVAVAAEALSSETERQDLEPLRKRARALSLKLFP
jgi:hypothetical protein